MKLRKAISVTFIFILASASLIFLYFELEPYELNPFKYSRLKGDKYMMLAPIYLFLCISSFVFNINKFISLRFLKGFLFKTFRIIDIVFSIILIITSLLFIFLTDAIPMRNTFAISFFLVVIVLSCINLIDSLRLKIR